MVLAACSSTNVGSLARVSDAKCAIAKHAVAGSLIYRMRNNKFIHSVLIYDT